MLGRLDDWHDTANYIYLIGADRLSQELHDISETVNEKYIGLNLDYKFNEEGDPTIDLTEAERKYFFETFGNISDEIFIENVVPQWAETKQNSLTSVGMYGQKIDGYKEICPFVFMYLHFNSDGTVAGCTLDWARKVLIGDAKVESAKSIWEGEKLRELRLKMLQGRRNEIPFCDTCDAPMVCCNEDLDPFADKIIQNNLY